jgi:hypothetical protein
MFIYRPTDLIPVEFSDGEESFCLYFSPVTIAQKTDIMAKYQAAEQSAEQYMVFVRRCLGLTLKKASGLQLADRSEWQPEIVNGELSDQSFDDLMGLSLANKITTIAGLFLRAVPREGKVVGLDGKDLEGVVVKKRM